MRDLRRLRALPSALVMLTLTSAAMAQRPDQPGQGTPSQGQQHRQPDSAPPSPQRRAVPPEEAPRRSTDPTKPGEKRAAPQRKTAPSARGGPAAPKALPVETYVSPERQRQQLNDLYALLQTAPDTATAKKHAAAIERMWQARTSETAIVLIERAGVALAAKDTALALDLLNEAVQHGPDQTETWMRRAYYFASQGNIRAAAGDLRRVVALDPSHFKALQTLTNMLKDIGEKPAALKFGRQLKDIYPFVEGLQTVLDELERTVEGQGT